MVDVRGDYRLRLGLLVAMTAVFVGTAALGTVASGHLAAALAATALVALCGGLWRHLSSDYGMAPAISSTLVVLIALASPRQATVSDHAFAPSSAGSGASCSRSPTGRSARGIPCAAPCPTVGSPWPIASRR